jgi:hypothetical protein
LDISKVAEEVLIHMPSPIKLQNEIGFFVDVSTQESPFINLSVS